MEGSRDGSGFLVLEVAREKLSLNVYLIMVPVRSKSINEVWHLRTQIRALFQLHEVQRGVQTFRV